jgi:hypothetical protein
MMGRMSDFHDFGTPRTLEHGHAWGPWLLDANRLCLCRVRDGSTNPEDGVYEIDLEGVTNVFWIIEWLEQIRDKTWATPEVIGHLSRAFIDIFNPRNKMRPDDIMRVDVQAILRERIKRDVDE